MTIERAEEHKETRIIVKSSHERDVIPSTSIVEREGKLEGLYKGEIALKTHATTNSSEVVVTAAGLFFRVGAEQREIATDKLVRVGPAYIAKKVPQLQSTDVLQPDVPNINNTELLQIGQLWLRQGDNAAEQDILSNSLPEAYINTGTGKWQRITPIKTSQTELGLIELANNTELEQGVDNERAVTPATLEHWKRVREIVTEKEPSFEFFVDGYAGDDSIENDGRDLYRPFRTIERALIEVSKVSYLPGNTDHYANSCVYVGIGDYLVDNRQGCSDITPIVQHTASTKGPIQPLEVGTITSYNALERRIVVSGLSTEVKEGKQIFFGRNGSEGLGHAVVEAINQSTLTLKMIKGTVYSNAQGNVVDKIYIPQHFQYNNNDGGIIVPRGCSIVGGDLRKTRIRPRYLGDLSLWQQDNVCAAPGRTSIFKLTGGTHITTFTFGDNLEEGRSHHICTCVEFCSNAELGLYYQKIVKGVGSTRTPAVVGSEFSIVIQETEIVAPTLTNTNNNVNTVAGTSPYVFNCSVLSRYGLCGMLIDGAKVTGLKSMVTAQFTNVSLQIDDNAFVADINAPGGKAYKEEWRHFAFKAINNGYAQIVSCFVIGSAAHYVVDNGGELSITNSCSNFGDLGLVAQGNSSVILPQDKGGSITKIIPPKKIAINPIEIPLLTLDAVKTTNTKLYFEGDASGLGERLTPFSLQNGETVYIKSSVGGTVVERTATLVTSGAVLGSDAGGYFLNIQAGSSIVNNKTQLASYPIYIKRIPDSRTADERIYWFKVDGLSLSGKRRPVENFVLRFASGTSDNKVLGDKIFVGLVKDKYHDGTPLQVGSYLISVLSSNNLGNDVIEDIYPPVVSNIISVSSALETSPSGKSYVATSKVLSALLEGDVSSYLEASDHNISKGEKVLNNKEIKTEFAKPSLIRCSGHTFEWVGYLNYSSALPQFQDKVLSTEQSLKKMKRETNGGRVYHTAMDQDGNFFIGNKLIDLKTGEEKNTLGTENNDSKIFKRVTISDRLLLFPNSTLDIRSTKVLLDSQTNFENNITPTFSSYAKTDAGGFVQLATVNEAKTNPTTAIINPKAISVESLAGVLNSLMPLGTIIQTISQQTYQPAYGTWLIANGSEIDVHLYPEFYTAMGSPQLSSTPTPSSPSGKFRLPDATGRVLVGAGGAAYPLRSTGNLVTYGGAEQRTISSDQMPSHTHSVNPHTHTVNPHSHTVNPHTHTINPHTHSIPNHNHAIESHTHTVNGHTHPIPNHNHAIESHTHTVNGHTHPIPNHNHAIESHTHTVNRHTHPIPNHNHAIEPHSHILPPHSHTVNPHTHSISDHSHFVNPHTHTTPPHTHTVSPHSHETTGHNHTSSPHTHSINPHEHNTVPQDFIDKKLKIVSDNLHSEEDYENEIAKKYHDKIMSITITKTSKNEDDYQ